MDVETALKSLETSGGYAILLGVVLIGLFYITREWQKGMAQRAAAREAAVREDFRGQLDRERANQETISAMTDRMITALDGNTRVIAMVTEVVRDTNGRLEAIDRYFSRLGSSSDK
jgi:hypothetical protein